jgi:hypothetical protein
MPQQKSNAKQEVIEDGGGRKSRLVALQRTYSLFAGNGRANPRNRTVRGAGREKGPHAAPKVRDFRRDVGQLPSTAAEFPR